MARISKAQLVKLQKKFQTDAAIGEQFGITRQAVHQLRKKYEIESSLADNPQRNGEIVKEYQAGTSGTALAKKFGLSISQTYRIINESNMSVKPPKKAAEKKAAKASKAAKTAKVAAAKKGTAVKAAKTASKKPAVKKATAVKVKKEVAKVGKKAKAK